MDPAELMRLAIEKSRAGIAAGQSPFGCAIARDGQLLSCSHNTVVLTTDITAHAEVNAIREADRKSTRLNSSHSQISYAVFCLKIKIKTTYELPAAALRVRHPTARNLKNSA